MGNQHHLSRRKSYQQAIAVLKERMTKHKKIVIAYRLADFDNVMYALNDIGICVPFEKQENIFNAKYIQHSVSAEWSNKYHKYVKSEVPGAITINWDYVDMTLQIDDGCDGSDSLAK